MAKGFDLIDSSAGLFVGIVARTDCAHGCGFVACVGLRGVFEVGVGAAGAVDTDVACVGDVRATVGFAHDGHDGDA